MANIQNLKPFTNSRSREEAVKNGRSGGIASGRKRRERATLRRELEELLLHTIKDDDGSETMIAHAISAALVAKAIDGDIRAFEAIRDTIGEKPVQELALRPETDFSALDAAFEEMKGSRLSN